VAEDSADGAVGSRPEVTSEVSDGVAVVRFVRPDRHNSLNPAQRDELIAALEAVAADDAVRVVVLTGSGRYFNVGGDLGGDPSAEAKGWTSPEGLAGEVRTASRATTLLARMPKVTIAAINGACAGAGFSLALAADLRYAARSARLNTGYLAAGVPGDMGGLWFAVRLLGTGRASELFFLPGRVEAARAAELGLVNAVIDDDRFEEHVLDLARRIADAPVAATRAMKANVADAVDYPLDDYLEREIERMVPCVLSEDGTSARRLAGERHRP
jgi:2-(1,2-epoxy-1,2-dihydrophenyl)acetyl-CoA isomerase